MLSDKIDPGRHPFNIRAFGDGLDLELRSNVTFLVGENGSGKSTLLEAVAKCCGFTKEFLDSPERFFKHLFAGDEGGDV